MTTLQLILLALIVSSTSAKPNILVPVVPPTTVVAAQPPAGIAHVPAQVGTAISKTVHYAETPVMTGYTSTLYKPNLGPFDSPLKFNHHQRYLRPVKTLVPRLMALEPQVQAVAAMNEVEIHPPILPEVRVANPASIYYPPVFAPLMG